MTYWISVFSDCKITHVHERHFRSPTTTNYYIVFTFIYMCITFNKFGMDHDMSMWFWILLSYWMISDYLNGIIIIIIIKNSNEIGFKSVINTCVAYKMSAMSQWPHRWKGCKDSFWLIGVSQELNKVNSSIWYGI